MTDDTWTVKRILEWIEGYLAQHGDSNPRVSAQWLVSEALGVSRMQLFLDAERPLTADERAVLRDWTRRRGTGEPLQYITGEAAFRHITVKVRAGVLIPRPETEVLVSEALALLPAAPKPQDAIDAKLLRQFAELTDPNNASIGSVGAIWSSPAVGSVGASSSSPAPKGHILMTLSTGDLEVAPTEPIETPSLLVADICTGSGCIACSIATEHPNTRVIATDISPEAVALARENACALELGKRVDVLECDLADGIDDSLLGTFDLVVSNPPYVPTDVLADIPNEVADFEPSLALDGGPDGLAVYRRLLDWCALALKPGGAFAFELHETCLEDAAAEADYAGFTDVRIIRDLTDRPRILTARKR